MEATASLCFAPAGLRTRLYYIVEGIASANADAVKSADALSSFPVQTPTKVGGESSRWEHRQWLGGLRAATFSCPCCGPVIAKCVRRGGYKRPTIYSPDESCISCPFSLIGFQQTIGLRINLTWESHGVLQGEGVGGAGGAGTAEGRPVRRAAGDQIAAAHHPKARRDW